MRRYTVSMNDGFYLASKSPRRRELLEAAGLTFSLLAVDVPEVPRAGEGGAAYVRRIVADKRDAALCLRPMPRAVLIADTEVLLGDEALGKPANLDDAAHMLRRLSGRTHEVLTRVMVADGDRSEAVETLTRITFLTLSDAQIARYCASGEPLGKAGSYAVQGAAAGFIRVINGSLTGVIGLPLAETVALLADFGIEPPP